MSTSSTLAPLHLRAFRALLIAELVSSIGTWMQTVGAQWFLVREPNAALLVALVQVVDTFPDVAFGWLGGVLADTFDRRRLLIVLNLFLTVVGAALTLLTAIDAMSPALLLTFTFLLGTASVVSLPAYQSLVNDIVPRIELPAAAALSSLNINVARAVSPAIAGLLIARTGVVGVFALNTLAFLFYVVVMLVWRPQLPPRQGRPEPFVSAVITGGLLLPRINAWLSLNQLAVIASLVLAAAMIVVVTIPRAWLAVVVLVPAGAASIVVIANINAALQMFLPSWVRGRGLSVFQMVLFGSLGFGSLAFGLIGDHAGVVVALMIAGVAMALGAATIARWPFPDVSATDRTRWSWPEPRLASGLQPTNEAVMVTVTYTVPPDHEPEFVAGMEEMRLARLSTGAVQWGLFRDAEAPQQFTEFFVVDSWE